MSNNWKTKTLDEICDVIYGTRVVNKRDGGSKYPVYGGGGATFFMDDYNRENQLVIARFAMSEQCTRFVNGKFFLNDSGLTVASKNEKELLQGFLDLQIIFLSDHIYSLARGTAQKNLDVPAFRNIKISYPDSLSEQHRMVAILNEAFAAIAKAKENNEKNLRNATELFESYLQAIFTTNGEGWEKVILKNEIDLLTGFAFKSKDYTEEKDAVLLLRGDNIMQGDLRWENAKRWRRSEYNNFKKYQLQENDIVLAMDRPWVKAGLKCARLSKIDLPALLVQRTACLRNKSKLDSSFLYYLIKSRGFMNHLLAVQTGLGVPHISGQQILNFTYNRPSIIQQQNIVKKLDSLIVKIKNLEAVYLQRLANLEELKKSFLHQFITDQI